MLSSGASLVPAVSVAVGASADSRGGVAKAQLATAFIVTAARAKLRAIKGGKQTAPSDLARDGRARILRAGRAGGGVLRGIGHACSGAAVGVTNEHASEPVNGDVVEVEQIAAQIASSSVPDASALHRVGRRCVRRRPRPAAVPGECDIKVPHSRKIRRLSVARRRSSEETEARPVILAANPLGKLPLLDA